MIIVLGRCYIYIKVFYGFNVTGNVDNKDWWYGEERAHPPENQMGRENY